MNKIRRIVAAALLISIGAISMGGCEVTESHAAVKDLMAEISVDVDISSEAGKTALNNQALNISEFGVNLFRESYGIAGGNVLVSPLSVIYALAMTANGADSDTLTEMLSALSTSDLAELNTALMYYMYASDEYDGNGIRPDVETETKFNLANSIWFKDDEKLNVKEDFLTTNATYYKAGLYKAEFNEDTRKAINTWILDNTDNMINDMLKEIPDDAIMYLINALAFQAEWDSPYEETSVIDGVFHGTAGDQGCKFMNGTEYGYLEDENTTGFMKYYNGYNYAMVALLPDEGENINEYVKGLTGDKIKSLISGIDRSQKVIGVMPQFESESALSLKEVFQNLGMELPFDDEKADYNKLGTYDNGNIFIGDIIHNTYINVDRKGTKAGAATIVEMLETTAMMEEPPKEVVLDRPFIYMVVDMNTEIPIFIGAELLI